MSKRPIAFGVALSLLFQSLLGCSGNKKDEIEFRNAQPIYSQVDSSASYNNIKKDLEHYLSLVPESSIKDLEPKRLYELAEINKSSLEEYNQSVARLYRIYESAGLEPRIFYYASDSGVPIKLGMKFRHKGEDIYLVMERKFEDGVKEAESYTDRKVYINVNREGN